MSKNETSYLRFLLLEKQMGIWVQNACTQATNRFSFCSKMRNFTVVPKRLFVFFYPEIQNFTNAPERPFVFSQRDTKF